METLWDKIKDAMDKGVDRIQKYTDVAVEKAGESAEIVKFKLKKLGIERKIYKNLARVGATVYDYVKKGKNNLKDMPKVDHLLNDTKKLDKQLVKIISILDDLTKS